jgi:hypothetical protein
MEEFNSVVDGEQESISAWGARLSELKKPLSELMEEDFRHPYWAFLHMLKLREITGYDDKQEPEVVAADERFARELRTELALPDRDMEEPYIS